VRHAQAVLQRLGLLAGPIDGDLGPATRDAIIRFEAARHLAIDPRVSDSLLAALGEAAAGATAESSPPAPPPAPSAAAAPPAGATPPAAPQTAAEAPAEAPSGATGRQPLPPGVNPPPIR
jgi:peptidoglycan hydrolase-like protein with peptidoglycan-binding domain